MPDSAVITAQRECHGGRMTADRGIRHGRGLPAFVLLFALVLSGAGGADVAAGASSAGGDWWRGASGSATPPAHDVGEAPGYPWQWPTPGPRTVIAPFRAPVHDYGPGHRGMDIVAQAGAEVRAPAAGVVAFRGVVADRPLLTIDHGDGYVSTLEPVESGLSPGDAVSAGAGVGIVAAGGHTSQGALHVGVRVDKRYVNPRGLFGLMPRAVLLPCCAG